jgi:peptidoglycan/LPS O-acetylase OafA/YrhL
MASGADGSFQRLFGMRPFVWIGQRSYGIYLWHYMILQFGLLSFKLPIGIAGPISILGGLLCAAVSYRWIERPFLRRKYSSAPREALIEAPQAGVTT